MMGHYIYKGPILCEERAQISRYAADHRVAFPDLLNADKGQLQHEIVPPFFKNKSHSTEIVRGTCPMIVAIVNVDYHFR